MNKDRWNKNYDYLNGGDEEDPSKDIESRNTKKALLPYVVEYSEPGLPHHVFHCQAEDIEHAKEQCINAYPDSKILRVTHKVTQ
tara:strand:+ start:1990 stop:2241 length:252 start_codon:yes stop_codon:yes gene_type:complete